ncbi:MAG TPA: hypothetical protein VJZ04_09165 [Lachnospiraceae bacterium]|nr:hypothetical protein [Lachnospiraceae bacterium]
MNKKSFGINIGSSSILMIFVILCMVSFATLSIVSANADFMLSNKMASRNIAYYQACSQAEHSIASIDKTLQLLSNTCVNEEDYFIEAGHEISFIIGISDLQSLQVEMNILYPTSSNTSRYQITAWKVITTGTLDYNESLPIITSPKIQ